jgi:hypothetical protein
MYQFLIFLWALEIKTAVVNFQPALSRSHDKKGRRCLKPQQVAQITSIKFDAQDKPTVTFKVFLRPEDLFEEKDQHKAREMHPNIVLPSKKNGINFKIIRPDFKLNFCRCRWPQNMG